MVSGFNNGFQEAGNLFPLLFIFWILLHVFILKTNFKH